jgi:hypothetical protein
LKLGLGTRLHLFYSLAVPLEFVQKGAAHRGEYRQAAGVIALNVARPPVDALCSLWDAVD